MSFYQSFPGDPGDSNSMAKLASLPIPDLCGKSFLDVGCNEGFFCGYAVFEGARSVTGIDNNAEYLARAKARFPMCQFERADWVEYLQGCDRKFDVVLCASALHYAASQPELVRLMVEALAPGGLLVLEIGVASSDSPDAGPSGRPGWLLCRRGIDERLFPTWAGVNAMLAPYAWKEAGESVMQKGDPVKRFVFHVRQSLPYAICLFGEPGSGKSTAARRIFPHLPLVGGDVLWCEALSMESDYPALAALARQRTHCGMLNQLAARMFEDGSWREYVEIVGKRGSNADFVFDGYIPEEYRGKFMRQLARQGYFPVRFELPRPLEPAARMERNTRREARKYAMFLAALTGGRPGGMR